MRIAIGADHAGYELKELIKQTLDELRTPYRDFGADSDESVDYPDYAAKVGRAVAAGEFDRGILICGTGIGMAIAANKFPGVRAAPCSDEVTAEISRRHNNLNVLCLSADMLSPRAVERMVEVWLSTPFEGGRHERRVEKIHQLEKQTGG